MTKRKRSPHEKRKHDKMVCNIARRLKSDGYPVGAWGKCGIKEDLKMKKYNDKWPDVETVIDGKRIIIEVETENTINHSSTREQLKAFAKYHLTDVWVPEGLENRMKRKLGEWRIPENTVRICSY